MNLYVAQSWTVENHSTWTEVVLWDWLINEKPHLTTSAKTNTDRHCRKDL